MARLTDPIANVHVRRRLGFVLLLSLLAAGLPSRLADAAPNDTQVGSSAQPVASPVHQFGGEVALVVLDGNLQGLIEKITLLGGVRVRFNDRLDEIRITNVSLRGTLRELLDDVSRRYSLSWFAERDLVEISKADSSTVKTYSARFLTDARVRDAVQRFGLVNVDFALGFDEKSGFVRVFGPPRLQDRLEAILRGLRPPQMVDETLNVIRFGVVEQNVFRGEGAIEGPAVQAPSPQAAKPQAPPSLGR